MFKRMLEHSSARPEEFEALASDLFRAMRARGRVGSEQVAWFNTEAFPRLPANRTSHRLANIDAIDPSRTSTK
jgi:hypothetical protein